jgi:glycosyltransferase involved in cell wall biosynthesis
VINLHWVANFLDYETFFPAVASGSPIVWTLHDMNAFTGGCHYDLLCGRYTDRCGACPQLGSRDDADLSRGVWQRKHELLARQPRLHVVTPSRWLKGEVARSSVLGHAPVSVIPYGLDVETFAPRDKQAARDVLGIPQDRKVVLFVADLVDNRRKGFGFLIQALLGEEDRATNLFLLSLGYNKPARQMQTPWLHLERIDNDRILSLVYSAADVFVIPSVQDNLPNTVLEAMACGTPVVGVAVGGIPDMVRHERTGLLVAPDDTAGLRKAIRELCHDAARREDMSVNCRRVAVQEYSLEEQGRRYVDLYTSLL